MLQKVRDIIIHDLTTVSGLVGWATQNQMLLREARSIGLSGTYYNRLAESIESGGEFVVYPREGVTREMICNDILLIKANRDKFTDKDKKRNAIAALICFRLFLEPLS